MQVHVGLVHTAAWAHIHAPTAHDFLFHTLWKSHKSIEALQYDIWTFNLRSLVQPLTSLSHSSDGARVRHHKKCIPDSELLLNETYMQSLQEVDFSSAAAQMFQQHPTPEVDWVHWDWVPIIYESVDYKPSLVPLHNWAKVTHVCDMNLLHKFWD